jgi:hypothetical protein
MILPEEGHLLRVFVGESDKHEGKPLYEWLVLKAREQGLAGATVLRGIEGFGAHSRMHTAKILRPPRSTDRGRIVDTKEDQAFTLGGRCDQEGLATLERCRFGSIGQGKAREVVSLRFCPRRSARRIATTERPSGHPGQADHITPRASGRSSRSRGIHSGETT